jgi:hypothetical protein
MKVKYLIHKETREFVEVTTMCGTPMVFTSELPHMSMNGDTSDDEILEYLKANYPTINFDDYEVVEFDVVISGDIGADIRNKLTPPKNLVAMLEDYFSIANEDTREKLLVYIKREMEQTKTSIDYLSKLL